MASAMSLIHGPPKKIMNREINWKKKQCSKNTSSADPSHEHNYIFLVNLSKPQCFHLIKNEKCELKTFRYKWEIVLSRIILSIFSRNHKCLVVIMHWVLVSQMYYFFYCIQEEIIEETLIWTLCFCGGASCNERKLKFLQHLWQSGHCLYDKCSKFS